MTAVPSEINVGSVAHVAFCYSKFNICVCVCVCYSLVLYNLPGLYIHFQFKLLSQVPIHSVGKTKFKHTLGPFALLAAEWYQVWLLSILLWCIANLANIGCVDYACATMLFLRVSAVTDVLTMRTFHQIFSKVFLVIYTENHYTHLNMFEPWVELTYMHVVWSNLSALWFRGDKTSPCLAASDVTSEDEHLFAHCEHRS